MDARQNLTIRKTLFVTLLALIALSMVLGVTHRGQWNIPDEAKLRQKPQFMRLPKLSMPREFCTTIIASAATERAAKATAPTLRNSRRRRGI